MGMFCKVISLQLSSDIKGFSKVFCCEVSGGNCNKEVAKPSSIVFQDIELHVNIEKMVRGVSVFCF